MKANILKFIADTVSEGISSAKLGYGIFDFKNNCIYSTDTKALLKFYYVFDESNQKKRDVSLVHPIMLRGTSELLKEISDTEKEDIEGRIENGKIYCGESYFSLYTSTSDTLPDFEKVLGRAKGEDYSCDATDLWCLAYDIHRKNIMFDEKYLKPLFSFFGESYPANRSSTPEGYTLWLCTSNQKSPIMIRCKHEEDILFEYLIMPMEIE